MISRTPKEIAEFFGAKVREVKTQVFMGSHLDIYEIGNKHSMSIIDMAGFIKEDKHDTSKC